jgi:surfeit locus 1 family protein
VTGLLFASQEREGIGPRDPTGGRLDELSRLDLDRLQQQYGTDLYPMWLQLADTEPPVEGELPVLLPEPEQDEGPHLSYAVQWFLFATVGAVGWPLLLRRTAAEDRTRADRAGDPPAPAGDDRPLEAAR